MINLAAQLERNTHALGSKRAIIYPAGKDGDTRIRYRELSYAEFHAQVAEAATGLAAIGIGRGTRTVLLASGPDLYVIAFALFRLGAVPVVVDPGIGMRRILHCYRTARATAFVGPPTAHVLRIIGARAFRHVRAKVTIGRRWFWGGHSFSGLPRPGEETRPAPADPDDLAMIVFTTGSTGPPKGVEYAYRMVDSIARQVRDAFGHSPDDVSLVTAPSHGMFDLLAGSTIVLASFSPGKVADADPGVLTEALQRFGVSTMFASPALLRVLAHHLITRSERLPRLRSIVSGGASIPVTLATALRTVLDEQAKFHVTYGATEALLICSIDAEEMAAVSKGQRPDAGSCVGHPVAGTEVQIIAVHDGPPGGDQDDLFALPAGHVGEVVVAGASVSRRYYADATADAFHKMAVRGARPDLWHRTGDLGYFDKSGRLWLCGRRSQRVRTSAGDLYPLCCEPVFDAHPLVRRSALVGIDSDGDGQIRQQTPVVCVETVTRLRSRQWNRLVAELRALAASEPATAQLRLFLPHPAFPVDARHNAKIIREELAPWAARRIGPGRLRNRKPRS